MVLVRIWFYGDFIWFGYGLWFFFCGLNLVHVFFMWFESGFIWFGYMVIWFGLFGSIMVYAKTEPFNHILSRLYVG
jgi:hypothetical protein